MGSRIDKHRGRVFAVHGDSLLAEFASVVDAVECAVAIREELRAKNGELPEAARMPFRINPKISAESFAAKLPYKDPKEKIPVLEALRKAGL